MPTITYKHYGRNNVDDALNVGAPVPKIRQLIFTEGTDLVNADPDNDGGCSRRGGFVKRYTGNVRSMFANDDIILFHEGQALKQFNPDTFGSTFLNISLGATADVAYCDVNGLIVYSDNSIIRKIYAGADYPLATPTAEFKLPVPAGRCFARFKQHLLVGQADGFVVTDPESVDEMDRRQCYFPLGGPAIEIMPVDDGLFVSTDKCVKFIAGHGLPQWLQPGAVDTVFEYPAIPGTGAGIKVNMTGMKDVPGKEGVMFATSMGYCYGLPGGMLISTEAKVRPGTTFAAGTAVLREMDGLRHYLAVLRTAVGAFHGEVVNVKTQGAGRYTGYDFRSVVCHKGRLFGCNAAGIYEMTGSTDDGTAIDASGTSGVSSCGSDYIKYFPYAYLSVRCEGEMEFTLAVDEQTPRSYPVTFAKGRDGIHRKPRKLAQGVKGGQAQISWRNVDGCDFYLQQAELDVLPTKRKVM
jgi:hypothetical protein